uniref:Uncharacterized protein n=1 Tax=Inoviridae sp. ct1ro12 TaxID=2826756 RepID=A0A8S5R0J7_9VIRU|nr:MAG TPA: hypothetical protein [Inoviridae sp. ct1ro12]
MLFLSSNIFIYIYYILACIKSPQTPTFCNPVY